MCYIIFAFVLSHDDKSHRAVFPWGESSIFQFQGRREHLRVSANLVILLFLVFLLVLFLFVVLFPKSPFRDKEKTLCDVDEN